MRIRLATKIWITITCVVGLVVVTSVVALLPVWSLRRLLEQATEEYVRSVRAAEEMELALLEQKGLVSHYLLGQRQSHLAGSNCAKASRNSSDG